VLGVCDRNYFQYSNIDHYWPTHWLPFVQGAGPAPEQYRVGVKLAAWWLVQHLGWGFRHGFALMDVVSSLVAVFLLYDLLQGKRLVRSASVEVQWFASAAFVMLVCFYLAWSEFFFRPETLPAAGLAAVMFWLWSPRGSPPSRLRQVLLAFGVVAAAALQAWIRADVACVLNVGMLLVCFSRFGHGLSLPRRAAVLTSSAAIAVAAATQLYIMRVKYPHASYGSIPIFMARHDLRRPLTFPPFIFFILPIVWTGVYFWRQRAREDSASAGLIVGSTLYLILWIVMGKLDEVRIFIPFALALAPLTVELAARRIHSNSVASGSGEAAGHNLKDQEEKTVIPPNTRFAG
jgi:hypothetical protein